MLWRKLLCVAIFVVPGTLFVGGGPSGAAKAPPPGTIVHASPIADAPSGSIGWRVVYSTRSAQGGPAESSGTVYAPTGPAPKGGRFVVAWAHPTIGDSGQCTPSEQSDPAADIPGFAAMIANGSVIASTDYTGLGSPGTLPYLVGKGEAYDVIDSVRAAQHLGAAHAGSTYGVWGWSQGGNASLFSAQLTSSYAPSLHLVGSASAAPAAELAPLFSAQYANNSVVWFIAPEILGWWPLFYKGLPTNGLVSTFALSNFKKAGAVCITGSAAQATEIGPYLGQPFFLSDPMSSPPWRARATQNTPTSAKSVPYFIAQGSADTVVLPATTELLRRDWCSRGVALDVDTVEGATHLNIAAMSASTAVQWLADRFARKAAPRTC